MPFWENIFTVYPRRFHVMKKVKNFSGLECEKITKFVPVPTSSVGAVMRCSCKAAGAVYASHYFFITSGNPKGLQPKNVTQIWLPCKFCAGCARHSEMRQHFTAIFM